MLLRFAGVVDVIVVDCEAVVDGVAFVVCYFCCLSGFRLNVR